jgi:predicted AAA+ superfamily ATPase
MLFKRDLLRKTSRVLSRDEFIIITGARQTGKTSLLIMLKETLENQQKNTHYFNLENPDYLKLLNKHPYNIFELIPSRKGKQYIFIDEIQYLDNPSNFLKLLFDENRHALKIIASGSSAFYIDKKFKDSLAGRKFLFELFPLNFDEYIIFKKKDELLEQKNKKLSLYYRNKLLSLWEEYLIYGGYPKVVLAESRDMRKAILEEIGSSYIKKDASEAGVKNTDKYFNLLKILADQVGQLVNSQELANTLNVAHKTVEEYLGIMKKSYQIAMIKPFYKNLRKELTKMPKVFFYDLGLRNFFLGDFTSPHQRRDKGSFFENVVFREFLRETSAIDQIKFWRTQDQHEVDFVVKSNAFEVKSDPKKIRKGKYDRFKKQYPGIRLKFITPDTILDKFYNYRSG